MRKALVLKRSSPDYIQIAGFVPKPLGLKFKIQCTARQIDQSTGLEEAIDLWLEMQKDKQAGEDKEAK